MVYTDYMCWLWVRLYGLTAAYSNGAVPVLAPGSAFEHEANAMGRHAYDAVGSSCMTLHAWEHSHLLSMACQSCRTKQAGEGRAGQGWAGQGRVGQGRAGQERAGEGWAGAGQGLG